MKILQTVSVKQVLTESSKNQLLEKYQNQAYQLRKELQPVSLKAHFEKEMTSRSEKLKLLDYKMEQLDVLPVDSELKEREVQGLVDVEVGSNWEELTKTKTIIVKDGLVIEIR